MLWGWDGPSQVSQGEARGPDLCIPQLSSCWRQATLPGRGPNFGQRASCPPTHQSQSPEVDSASSHQQPTLLQSAIWGQLEGDKRGLLDSFFLPRAIMSQWQEHQAPASQAQKQPLSTAGEGCHWRDPGLAGGSVSKSPTTLPHLAGPLMASPQVPVWLCSSPPPLLPTTRHTPTPIQFLLSRLL